MTLSEMSLFAVVVMILNLITIRPFAIIFSFMVTEISTAENGHYFIIFRKSLKRFLPLFNNKNSRILHINRCLIT